MTTISKTILAASVTGLVAGGIIDYSGFHLDAAWAAVLPLGAIFYGMFLISFMMEKEVAKFDEDEAKERLAIDDPDLQPLWDSIGGTLWKKAIPPLTMQSEVDAERVAN